MRQISARMKESGKMNKTLKEVSFAFAGWRLCEALMQAAKIVNDGLVPCLRRAPIRALDTRGRWS